MRHQDMTCAVDMPVALRVSDGPICVRVERTAREWAFVNGLGWETARKRRYRGDSWSEALEPCLRRSSFNDREPGIRQAQQHNKGNSMRAGQMARIEIEIPVVAHIVVTGVSEVARALVMSRIQEVLSEMGGTVRSSHQQPLERAAAGEDEVRKAIWLLNGA